VNRFKHYPANFSGDDSVAEYWLERQHEAEINIISKLIIQNGSQQMSFLSFRWDSSALS